MLALYLGAFMAGLAGGVHCVGMCGGFASMTAARGGVTATALYSLGRITTYATLGALAGLLGGALSGFGLVGAVISAVLLIWFAGRLAGWIPPMKVGTDIAHRLLGPLMRRTGPAAPWLFGAATALVPCGLVYAALALPIVSSSPASGAIAMALFGLGTVPLLSGFALGAGRLVRNDIRLKRVLAVAMLALGLMTLAKRVPLTESEPDCCAGHVEHADMEP
jgi:sulfite exporter TauE/SafE